MRNAGLGRAAAIAAALCLTPLAACGSNDGSGGEGAGASTDEEGNTTLTWTMWSGGTEERDAWQAAADAVHEADPSITVELETSSFDDYFAKIGTRIAGGSAPCIVSVQSLRLGTLVDGLIPLDDYIESENLDTDDFVPAALEGLQDDGVQYGLPYDNGPMFILYNKDMFADAGVPEPTTDWTTDDFLETAQALTTDGKYGIAAYPSELVMFPHVLSETGKQPVTEDGELQLTDPDIVAAVDDYAGLVYDQEVAPPLAGADTTFPYTEFIAGNVAMVADGPWDLLNIQSQSDFELGAVTMPAGAAGSKTLSGGSGFGISESCPEKDKAFDAITTITGKEVLSSLAEQGRAFPARVSAQQGWYDNAFPGAKEALDAASATAEPIRVTDDWAQVASDLVQFGVPAFNGDTPVADFLDQIQSEYGD